MDIVELARTHTQEEFQEILAARRASMEEFLQSYQGVLSIEQIHEGIGAILRNAAIPMR